MSDDEALSALADGAGPGPGPLRLLDRLVGAGGQAVPLDVLLRFRGGDQSGFERDVDALRAAGYVIERVHPHGATSYRLLEVPDLLYAHEVGRRLSTKTLGREIRHVERCASTNDLAKELARAGAASGAVVLSEEQTAGRGRAGRRWHSIRGAGLYVSLVYRPDPRPRPPPLLQITTGVAVAHAAMRLTGKRARIRWPNDVLFGGRKVAGLLVEALDVGTSDTVYVVGIGLNVNHEPEDFPPELTKIATSLRIEAEEALTRFDVLATLLGSLEEWYDRMCAGDVEAVAAAWRPLSSLLGKRVVLFRGDRRTTGEIKDLSPVDGVRISDDEGRVTWVPAEHVTLIRPEEEMTGE